MFYVRTRALDRTRRRKQQRCNDRGRAVRAPCALRTILGARVVPPVGRLKKTAENVYSLVCVRREVVVELERLRRRRAGRFVGDAGVQQERRRVFQRTGFAVGQAGRVRVVPVEPLQFHRCQLMEKRTKKIKITIVSTALGEILKREIRSRSRCLKK